MKHTDYILASARLPFDIGSLDPDASKLLEAAPDRLWTPLLRAHNHEAEIHAGDDIAEWIGANWRSVLPEVSARFV